ncbi:MAG: YqgE/AlgH family protein [Nitrospinota bacterium]|jgi:putative transcriptional regulator|nr:YqgE/AlgH family protein [Nitrospinota bacterium]MDP7580203.1 YqgE/AlgH family protein [Nitrospinota bacterium]HJN02395.1 YqgE/AlgH family protein [Nitrospinota bacterium]
MQKTLTKGSFLIANPRLKDPNFNLTVVLICEYNEDGAFGLVVNRILNVSIAEVLKNNPNATKNKDKVFSGGPVQTNHLLYLHNNNGLSEKAERICEGVYLGGDVNYLNNLLSNKTQGDISYRLYLGSAGWAAGQLDEELKIKSWIVCPGREGFVFHPEPDKLWRQVLRSMGGQYALLSTYPPDPILN